MEESMENKVTIRPGAYRTVRSVTQRFALRHTLNYNDVKHAAADITELMSRFNRVRALGGPFAKIELSPYISRMMKIVGTEKQVEPLPMTHLDNASRA